MPLAKLPPVACGNSKAQNFPGAFLIILVFPILKTFEQNFDPTCCFQTEVELNEGNIAGASSKQFCKEL